MPKYTVTATSIVTCYIDIEADSLEHAHSKARELDGADFAPDENDIDNNWSLKVTRK